MSGQPYNYDYILKYIIIGDQASGKILFVDFNFFTSGSWKVVPSAPIHREEIYG